MSRGRARSKNIKDQFPNFLTGQVVQESANVFASRLFNTPIPRVATGQKRATVMELLWIEAFIPYHEGVVSSDANDSYDAQFTTGTTPTTVLRFDDTRVFAQFSLSTKPVSNISVPLSGVGGMILEDVKRWNFQSQDGFGYLLAADQFHVSVNSFNAAIVQRIQWKLYYRFVDVDILEYVGLVQSLQQS